MRCHGVVIDCVGWLGVCGAGKCTEVRFVLDDDSGGDFQGVRSRCGDGERFSSGRFDFGEHFDEVVAVGTYSSASGGRFDKVRVVLICDSVIVLSFLGWVQTGKYCFAEKGNVCLGSKEVIFLDDENVTTGFIRFVGFFDAND